MSVPHPNEPIPAATLVMMRRGAEAPELLVMERAVDMSFAAGAIVFPGGRVDSDDYRLAERIGDGIAHAADRIAAIRETIEEVGIAAGMSGPIDSGTIGLVRRQLKAGKAFSDIAAEYELAFDLDALTPFAHWCPAHFSRRFDTKFFLAVAPADAPDPAADGDEAVRAFWTTAGQLLAAAAENSVQLIFPTRRNLERLAQFASVEEAFADVDRFPMQLVVPWLEEREGRQFRCIPEAIGYPVTAEPDETARRG